MEDGIDFPVDGLVYEYNPSVFVNGKQTKWLSCHPVSLEAELDGVALLFVIEQLYQLKNK